MHLMKKRKYVGDFISPQASGQRGTTALKSNEKNKIMKKGHLASNIGEIYQLFKAETLVY